MVKSSILDEISAQESALRQGQQLGECAAEVGFDWSSARDALQKVREEIEEVEELLGGEDVDRDQLSGELGDILFAVVNVARKLDVDAEACMQLTNTKFRRRFAFIEQALHDSGRRLEDVDLDEMEGLWQRAKVTLEG